MHIWHLNSNQSLRWKHWGDQSALYQVASGETHFLNPLGVSILMQIEANSSNLDQLCERIATEFDCSIDDDLRNQITASLMRFDELGLVQRQRNDDLVA
ncbi:HPr-rel-A system PqqD family peptide chaperone [Chromatium okenii]|uniref:HPr-rel-A system PqqD family peptide chaperone n=1 Tax=Chromatium okenii TaxID=61644 RepID=UPI0026F06072|nr:HPr-rel-A system PqqD family peptide chaperone [Chromatium okenii]MBV5310279.1 HPr-rel-A system PqqD family peptide chaperone [Chromatium okenii]